MTKESEILNEIFDKIFALQFSRTKCGDAWFYTNALDEGFFALFFNYFWLSFVILDQISLINEFSLSNVLCLIAPEMQVQGFVFLTPGGNNTLEPCKSNLDLSEWKLAETTTRSQSDGGESEFEGI